MARRRAELDLSQEEVSGVAGLSQSTYSDIENGKKPLIQRPYTEVLGIARGLQWTLIELQQETGLDLGQVAREDTRPPTHPSFKKFIAKMSDEYPELEDPAVQAKLQKMYFFDHRLDNFNAWMKAFELYLALNPKPRAN